MPTVLAISSTEVVIITASTHFTYPWRDGQIVLVLHPQMVT